MKLLVAVIFGLLFFVFSNSNVLAAGNNPYEGCTQDGILTLRCLPIVFSQIINYGIMLAGVVAVFFVTISGIKLISSGGEPAKVAEARRTLTYALIGLFIVLLSFTILKVVGRITGINCSVIGIESCSK